EVISYANALASSRPVDTTILFYASLSYSHQSSLPGVTSKLLELLAARQKTRKAPKELLDQVGRVLGTPPTPFRPTAPSAESAQTVVMPGSPTAGLLNMASDLAQRITGDSDVHLRHLVLATVLAQPPLSPDVLNALEVSPPELRALLLEAAGSSNEPLEA